MSGRREHIDTKPNYLARKIKDAHCTPMIESQTVHQMNKSTTNGTVYADRSQYTWT